MRIPGAVNLRASFYLLISFACRTARYLDSYYVMWGYQEDANGGLLKGGPLIRQCSRKLKETCSCFSFEFLPRLGKLYEDPPGCGGSTRLAAVQVGSAVAPFDLARGMREVIVDCQLHFPMDVIGTCQWMSTSSDGFSAAAVVHFNGVLRQR